MLRPHLEGERSLRAVASEASIPYRTAVRWASGYRKEGLVALARKSRTDQGARRLASTQLIKAIEGLALERPPLPIGSIHRQATAMAESVAQTDVAVSPTGFAELHESFVLNGLHKHRQLTTR